MAKKQLSPLVASTEKSSNLLDEIASNTSKEALKETKPLNSVPSLYIAHIDSIDENNQLWIRCSKVNSNQPLRAHSSIALSNRDISRRCFIAFIDGDLHSPVVTGWLHQPNTVEAEINLHATDKVSLHCGENKVEVTSSSVQIKGRSIISRARGTNRVTGGSVKLN